LESRHLSVAVFVQVHGPPLSAADVVETDSSFVGSPVGTAHAAIESTDNESAEAIVFFIVDSSLV